MADGFKDHFSTHAAAYAAARPSYPPALADWLAGASPRCGLALDCGCGSGQLSRLLAERFERVVATDASAEQIANAAARPNLDYRVAPAERSGLPDGSADLITVAQAAHWFDLPAFYAEMRRVASPGAALALIAYGVLVLDGEPGRVAQDFYERVLGDYWPPERALVESGYRDLPFPFAEEAVPPFAIDVSWTLFELADYVETWSAVRALERAEGGAAVERFRAALADAWGDPAVPRAVSWPLAIRFGRVRP